MVNLRTTIHPGHYCITFECDQYLRLTTGRAPQPALVIGGGNV